MNQNIEPDSILTNKLNNLWILMVHTTDAMRRKRELELAKQGISTEKHAILHALMIKDGSNIREIAEVRLRNHNTIFTLVNRMEKQGLVKKVKYPKSKEYRIFITDKGRELHYSTPLNSLENIFSALSAEDQQKLSQYLKLLLMRSLTLQGFDYKLPFLL
jgi:DNA-binding MarR family transcriptional regulator